jgi:hypothetical protein
MSQVIAPTSRCRLGLATGDITPPVGIYHRMWGASTRDRSTGIHRPLMATAMVIEAASEEASPATRLVFLTVDHVLLWTREMQDLLQTLSRRCGLPQERLVVLFSHTHAAGLMGRERAGLPGGEMIGPYLDTLADTLSELIREAGRNLTPAEITYATGCCTLAANRDYLDPASGQYVCGYNPAGPTDYTVLVGRICDSQQRYLATLVNYACHPTTLAWDNSLISPDFPGAMRETVQQHTGAPCLFVQGASGDLGPRDGFTGDVNVADRNGRQLAFAVLEALESMPPPGTAFCYTGPVVSGATIGTWKSQPLDAAAQHGQARFRHRRWHVELPFRDDLPTPEQTETEREHWTRQDVAARERGDLERARECRAYVERMTRRMVRLKTLPPGATYPLPLTLTELGDALWLTVEGEHYHALQRMLRDRFPGVAILVATLANGSNVFYLPTADSYGKGIYQEQVAVLAAGSLERLIAEVGDVMHSWLADDVANQVVDEAATQAAADATTAADAANGSLDGSAEGQSAGE